MIPSWQTHPDRALKILRKMRILIQDHPEYGLCAAYGDTCYRMCMVSDEIQDETGIRKPFKARLRWLLFWTFKHWETRVVFELQYWWPRYKANGEPNAEPRLRAINKAIERVQRHLQREIQKHLNQ